MNFDMYESDLSTTISAKLGHLLMVADLSMIDREIAVNYMKMCESEKDLNILYKDMDQYNKFYFFNRLNIPEKLRGAGTGRLLLNEVIKYCNENQIFLVNTASNYGDMGQSNLIKFYEDAGMKLVHSDGLLVYYPSLQNKQTNKIKI